jgi:enoyl-CoA hydratase
MKEELHHFWTQRQNDMECRVVILTGAGRAFCAGADIAEMDNEDNPFFQQYADDLYLMECRIHDLILLMRRAPQPIIAAVHGWAAGGGFSFTMAADVRIADPTAKFVASFINVGLSGGDLGSSYHLPREINLGRALEYLYAGEVMDAAEAERIGYVNHLVPEGELLAKARELAKKMTAKSELGLRMTKEALNLASGGLGLEEALYLENRNQVICLAARPIKNPLKKMK